MESTKKPLSSAASCSAKTVQGRSCNTGPPKYNYWGKKCGQRKLPNLFREESSDLLPKCAGKAENLVFKAKKRISFMKPPPCPAVSPAS